jgi:UDP-N-acetylmuramoyl-tripeptide--D-alanyl-D-alanine ligase
VPLLLGRWLIVNPRQRKLVAQSEQVFANHKGLKIAIAGSYGKTTMKELLQTVLGEGKKVVATPGNKNVSISHAYFARKLRGDEDMVLIEYGEGAPGDIARFAKTTHPDRGIITGVAPAHLDQYASIQAAGEDIFLLSDFVAPEHLYVNGESPDAAAFIRPDFQKYSASGALGWKVSDISVDFDGTSFVMQKGKERLKLHSGLLGRHLVGPLALVAALAYELGLSIKQIEQGVAKTKPFEHRMQPTRRGTAWVIDDTYNGNIEGMKAGLQLLSELPGTRKIYVTPGLVDQGRETERVHISLGKAIAAANPDKVVLMQNSVTSYIEQGLKAANYQGHLQIEHYPLDFYVNLEHFVATGDVLLMQNDWPDNYA